MQLNGKGTTTGHVWNKLHQRTLWTLVNRKEHLMQSPTRHEQDASAKLAHRHKKKLTFSGNET